MMDNLFKIITDNIKYWYVYSILGILSIIFGLFIIFTPLDSYLALSILFSVTFITTGLIDMFFYFSNRKVIENWGGNFVFGILTFLMGILLIINPGMSMITLSYLVGFTLLSKSISIVSFSIELRNYKVFEWKKLMFIGILGVISSFILLVNPLFTGLTIVGLIGLIFITIGVSQIYLSLKLKKLNDFSDSISGEVKSNYNKIKSEFESKVLAKIK